MVAVSLFASITITFGLVLAGPVSAQSNRPFVSPGPPFSSSSASPQIIGGGGVAAGGDTLDLTRFISMFSSESASGQAQESYVAFPMAVAGTLSQFRFYAASNERVPGVGESLTVTVRKNFNDTNVSCTFTGIQTQCSNLTDTVTFAAGDFLTIKTVASSTSAYPSGGTTALWSAQFAAQ
jgi:hypothetical protein